jgi:hypothetical protein
MIQVQNGYAASISSINIVQNQPRARKPLNQIMNTVGLQILPSALENALASIETELISWLFIQDWQH